MIMGQKHYCSFCQQRILQGRMQMYDLSMNQQT